MPTPLVLTPYWTRELLTFEMANTKFTSIENWSADVYKTADFASTNTASKAVVRDASGNFAAGTITANLTGNVTGNLTGNVTGDASLNVKIDGTRALTGNWNAGAQITATQFNGPLVGNTTGFASLNVLKAGDTMTGDLLIQKATPGLYLKNTDGSYANHNFLIANYQDSLIVQSRLNETYQRELISSKYDGSLTTLTATTVNIVGALTVGGNTVWNSNNDGSGSGLDADTVDNYHAGNSSGNIPISNGTVCTNLNADTVDGFHITKVNSGTVSLNANTNSTVSTTISRAEMAIVTFSDDAAVKVSYKITTVTNGYIGVNFVNESATDPTTVTYNIFKIS